jgi:hypothetical protein
MDIIAKSVEQVLKENSLEFVEEQVLPVKSFIVRSVRNPARKYLVVRGIDLGQVGNVNDRLVMTYDEI